VVKRRYLWGTVKRKHVAIEETRGKSQGSRGKKFDAPKEEERKRPFKTGQKYALGGRKKPQISLRRTLDKNVGE